MQGAFITYLRLGLDHITDIQAYDHMLFLLALCAVYTFKQRTKVFWLITAFTIGHSITLALSSLDILSFDQNLVELLIPVTIILTGTINLIEVRNDKNDSSASKVWIIKYLIVIFFGFIHGMGFSSFFKSLLGGSDNIVNFLFAFNVGVEIGQIFVVVLILLFSWLALNVIKIKQHIWNYVVSGVAIIASLYLIFSLIS